MKNLPLILFLCVFNAIVFGQENKFTHQDSLRGSITKERIWWDLKHYNLNIEVKPETKSISGYNIIKYKVLNPHQTIQIDLQEPMMITKVVQNEENLLFKRDGNVYFIQLKEKQYIDSENEITITLKVNQ